MQPLSPLTLANKGGVIQLFNADGDRIDRVRYDGKQGKTEGRPIIFAYRDR